MFNIILNSFLACFFWSSLLIGFFVIKGGFNKKFLYSDNILLTVCTLIIVLVFKSKYSIKLEGEFFIFIPILTFILFLLLFLYRFYRNPKRIIVEDEDHFLSPADGRIIYIKELDESIYPVSIKGKNMIKLDEITKTDMLNTPCYLIGIAMTFFDVHYQRSPVEGKIKLIKHTEGKALGLRNPISTFVNERNTFVIEDTNKKLWGVVQIAARGAKRCIPMVKIGDTIKQGQIIGKIRLGSQVDLIAPRDFTIMLREGDQVYAGKTIIGKK